MVCDPQVLDEYGKCRPLFNIYTALLVDGICGNVANLIVRTVTSSTLSQPPGTYRIDMFQRITNLLVTYLDVCRFVLVCSVIRKPVS